MRTICLLLSSTICLACSSESGSRTGPVAPSQAVDEPAALNEERDRELEALKLEIREKLPQVARIDVEELAARLDGPGRPLLLDARGAKEFAVSHLPGARRAETMDAARAALEGLPKDREIVVYCSIGYRSAYLADELQGEGFTNVRNLEGSIFEWANTGHLVYRGEEVVHEVHPYDETWGRLLARELWAEER